MDTLKSIAVIAMLGAVLYYVYDVAGKPEKPLPPEVAAHAEAVAPPQIETGSPTESGEPKLLSPPRLAAPNPLSNVPAPPPPPRFAPETKSQERNSLANSEVRPASNFEEVNTLDTPARAVNSLRNSVYESPIAESAPPVRESAASRVQLLEDPKASDNRIRETAPSTTDSQVTGVSYAASAKPSSEEIAAAQERVRTYAFHQAWKAAQDQAQESRHREALLTLSAFYNDSAVPVAERQSLLEWLDALAARVVYSTEHSLEPEYSVRRGETLYSIAERYRVPYLLLKNINGVRDPELLIPGTRLKVVPGPFRAEVSMSRKELTLFLGGLYAGRFTFETGGSRLQAGDYAVKEKSNRKAYHSAVGTLAPNDPRNPYGGIWLDLGGDACIHGSASEALPGGVPGCISLTPRDAEDVYGILSIGSAVTVKE